MPLFDAKTLENDLDGAALLASVLYATPQAKAEARARGLERLARAGSLGEASTPRADVAGERSASLGADQIA